MNESTYLGHGVDKTADCEDALDSASGVLADSALCARHTADLADVLTTFANDGRSFSA